MEKEYTNLQGRIRLERFLGMWWDNSNRQEYNQIFWTNDLYDYYGR